MYTPNDQASVRSLLELTRQFVSGELTAEEFDVAYRKRFLQLGVVDEVTFHILEELAVACDSYVENPELRESADDIDENTLLDSAKNTLNKLTAMSI